jgi:AraC-like DNA-binding protein
MISILSQPFQFKFLEFMEPWSQFSILKKTVETSFPVHWHEFCEVEFVISGEASQILNGTSYPLHKGSIFFLSPSDFHAVNVPKGGKFEVYALKFAENMLREPLFRRIFETPENFVAEFSGEAYDQLLSCFEKLLNEYENDYPFREMMINNLLEEILIMLIRKSGNVKTQKMNSGDKFWKNPVYRALGYIHKNYQNQIALEDVATYSHLSPSYFSRLFHSSIGCSFQSYLQELRLQAARVLLVTSELTINEICILAGFNTYAHFSRVFRKSVGVSPQIFRINRVNFMKNRTK